MITDLTSLMAAIKRWAKRDNLAADSYDEFVQLTESHLNTVLRVEDMTQRVRMTTQPGISLYSQPNNSLGIRSIEAEFNNRRYVLEPYTPETLVNEYGWRTQGGPPEAYAISSKHFEIAPCPNDFHRVGIISYYPIPSLTPSTPVNWLIEKYPMVYLYGGMHFLAMAVRDDKVADRWGGKLGKVIDTIEQADSEDRWSGSTPMMRAG